MLGISITPQPFLLCCLVLFVQESGDLIALSDKFDDSLVRKNSKFDFDMNTYLPKIVLGQTYFLVRIFLFLKSTDAEGFI